MAKHLVVNLMEMATKYIQYAMRMFVYSVYCLCFMLQSVQTNTQHITICEATKHKERTMKKKNERVLTANSTQTK